MNTDDVWVRGSPVSLSAGAQPIFSFKWDDSTTISSASTKIYKNGTDATATYMSGSTTTNSVDLVTTPTVISLVGGLKYVIVVTATVDGVVEERKLMLIVQKAGKEQ